MEIGPLMFCPNCACELPAVAKFCVKCGSRVEFSAPASRSSRSFCANCAKPLNASEKFCSNCGQKVALAATRIESNAGEIATEIQRQVNHYSQMSSDDLIRLVAELDQLTSVAQKALVSEIANRGIKPSSQLAEQIKNHKSEVGQPQSEESAPTQLPVQIAPTIQGTETAPITVLAGATAQQSTNAPYAKFVIQFLLCCLCASACVFALFDASARNTTDFAVEGLAILLALVFGWLGWTTWKRILDSEPKNEPKSRRRARNLLVTSIIFALLYLGLAALLGSVIGQNRAEAVQLNDDITRQKELADRISQARNAVSNSVSSYVAMYAGIESDVRDYLSTLLRLREELPKYDSKFPAQSETTRKFTNTVEREIRRSNILMKQIATAKRIASLDEYQQGLTWRSEMLPLLKEEDALDQSK